MGSPIFPQWGLGSGGQPVITPPSLGDSPGGNTFSMQLPLPEVLPIPDAHEFNIEGDKSTVVAENNIPITNATLAVPDGSMAVIRGVTFYIDNMLTTTKILFSLLINGAAPGGYGGVKIFPRAAPFVSNGFDSMIRFEGQSTVTVIYSNLDGGTYIVGATFSGWFWPTASDTRWKHFGAR